MKPKIARWLYVKLYFIMLWLRRYTNWAHSYDVNSEFHLLASTSKYAIDIVAEGTCINGNPKWDPYRYSTVQRRLNFELIGPKPGPIGKLR